MAGWWRPTRTRVATERKMTREELEATKPKREQFQTEEEFDEAYNYWMGRVGRILGMTHPRNLKDPSNASEPASASTDKS